MDLHDLDALSLGFGLAFASIGTTFLAVPVDVLDVPWEWLWPAVLIALGAALLVPALRRRDRPEAPEPGDGLEPAPPES
jgi:hypothetical protein